MYDILREGENCWKLAAASKVKFLIDGEAYFAALADAFELARESILIVGWDFDSRIRLKFESAGSRVAPSIGEILNSLAARRRDLQVHILVWDFAMIFALDREITPFFGPGWRRHSRVHFHMAGNHPVGASHHSKIVVIDDSLAFSGGLDIAKGRWDTREHRPDDLRRADFNGRVLPPHHDVQIAVSGEIAAHLGNLARDHWWRATGQRLRQPRRNPGSWPTKLPVDMTDAHIAIARTAPAYAGEKEVREIEALFRDGIAAARRWIYIENQYLSSAAIGDALTRRLVEPDGPEIILVISQASYGWLEGATMDVVRGRLMKRLCDADRYKRLRVYAPIVSREAKDCMSVHSKLMVVDDAFVRVGSANLSNRSMGLDTECDLALEANGRKDIEEAIAGFRNSLLAEHLGARPEQVAEILQRTGSLIEVVRALRARADRTLEKVNCTVPEWLDQMIPEAAVLDPEAPVAPESLIEEFVVSEQQGSASRALLRGFILLAALFSLVAAWRWTGLREWLDLGEVVRFAAWLRDTDQAWMWALSAFPLGGLVAFPVTLLIFLSAFLLHSWSAIACSLLGCILSAALLYGIGRGLGRKRVMRVAGRRLNRVNRLISKQGILAVTAVRMIPVAPYSLINLAAGAARVPFRDFILGTLLGMLPGVVGITFFTGRLEHMIRQPSILNLFVLIGTLIVLFGGITGLRRWITSKRLPRRRRHQRWSETAAVP